MLKVDGKDVAMQKMENSIPFPLQLDESLDIGSVTLTGVNDADYQSAVHLHRQAPQGDADDRPTVAHGGGH